MILLVGVNLFAGCRTRHEEVRKHTVKEDLIYSDTTHSIDTSDTKSAYVTPDDFFEVKTDSLDIINKMVYATKENFTKQQLYPCPTCWLRKDAAIALMNAQNEAKRLNYVIVIFDCYRPYYIQKKMYNLINNPDYVANPGKGSNHNKGCAVDVSLADSMGNLLNMGTEFDDFTKYAHYTNTAFGSPEGANRKLLRKIMTSSGFIPYDKEWWHFNYSRQDYSVADFIWQCK